MNQKRNFRRIAATVIGLVSVMALVAFIGSRPEGVSAETTAIPKASDLFDDVQLPYWGLGAVWIDANGMVVFEIAGKESVGFMTNVAGLWLVEVDQTVLFYREAGPGALVHQFPEQPVPDPEMLSVAFHIVGYLGLDYDQDSGLLEIEVDGAKQAFKAELSFENSFLVDSGASQQQQYAQNSCQCDCNYPAMPCTSSKTCDPGWHCMCRCRCGQSSSDCMCSDCYRHRRTGVDIVPIDPLPVDP